MTGWAWFWAGVSLMWLAGLFCLLLVINGDTDERGSE